VFIDARLSQKASTTRRLFLLPIVPDDLSLLASGMAPAREAEKAGGMTEVPQA